MKKLFSLVLCAVLLAGCFGMATMAAETVYPRVTHTYTVEDDFARDEWQTVLRGQYLLSGMSTIARNSSTLINISGETCATRVCDQVRLVLYVEQSESYATGYTTYRTYSYMVEDDYALAKEIINIPVERGYYYRVVGVHSVIHNGIIETTNSVTDPLDYR